MSSILLDQHKEFDSLLEELSYRLSARQLSMSDISETHTKLVLASSTHFAEEERLMGELSYETALADAHRAAHVEFMRRLVGLLSEAEASKDPINRALDTLLFLNSWLRKHGTEHDQPLIDALKGGVPEPG